MRDKLTESLVKIYDGKSSEELIHIPEISYYNHNYYIGVKRESRAVHDLIYVESDDDDFSEYYLVTKNGNIDFGYSLTSEGDIIHSDENI